MSGGDVRTRLAIPILALLAAAWSGPPRAETPAAHGGGVESARRVATLTDADVAGIRGAIEAYRTAWLRGDAAGVLATLTPDAVLLPAHGAAPIVGTTAITSYWWPPDGPPTTITRLDITVDGLQGGGEFASAYGRDDVEWTQREGGETRAHGHPGTYLNVMRKLPDGSWRISRHMWDDGPSH